MRGDNDNFIPHSRQRTALLEDSHVERTMNGREVDDFHLTEPLQLSSADRLGSELHSSESLHSSAHLTNLRQNGLPGTEGTDEKLDGLNGRSFKIENPSDGRGKLDRLPY
jgi:hypothetical protein